MSYSRLLERRIRCVEVKISLPPIARIIYLYRRLGVSAILPLTRRVLPNVLRAIIVCKRVARTQGYLPRLDLSRVLKTLMGLVVIPRLVIILTMRRIGAKTYCTGIGARADGNPFCTAAITNVCAGDSADIFDPLCFDAIYQAERADACKVTDLNDPRCAETVVQLCATNPFTQTTGGTTVDLCTDADDARAALVTRCAIETNVRTGCTGVSVGVVDLQQCIDDPYLTGCEDTAFDGIKTARYNNCIGQEAASFVCTNVETTICQSDSGKTNPLANPFLSLCRASTTNYASIQRAFCNARVGDNRPECEPTFIADCDARPV